jgi:hypothetical protein
MAMTTRLFVIVMMAFAAAKEDETNKLTQAPALDVCTLAPQDWSCMGPKWTRSPGWAAWARPGGAMPQMYQIIMYTSPLFVLVLMIIWLRILWPSPPPKVATVTAGFEDKKDPLASKGPVVFGAGDAVLSESEPYLGDWKTGFDLAFPIGWFALLAVLIVISLFSEDLPLVKTNVLVGKEFVNLLIKFGVMLSSSIIGGILARSFCYVNDRGYVKTNAKGKTAAKNNWFKVNYTRKIQHFAAYATPILVKSPFPTENWLTVCWGDMATLLGFLIVIQPIRECHAFFMMQFNAFDRPEDRPYTLKWIVLGDIVPGMVVLAIFYAIFGPYLTINGVPVTELCYIFAMVAGLGDGLAEPVGVYTGTHKFEVSALCAGDEVRKYQRSMEGSCCVAWWTYLFVIQKWYLFPNATSFWLTWLVLPPLMAWSEARSPHTMDTPFIFLVGGFWLWAMLYMPAFSLFEPSAVII